MKKKQPKILFWDIETSQMTTKSWGLWNQNINPNQIVQDWHIICINLYLSLLVSKASSSKPSASFKSSIIELFPSSWNLRFRVDIHEPRSLIEVCRDVLIGGIAIHLATFRYIWLFGYNLTTIIDDWLGAVNWSAIVVFLHAWALISKPMNSSLVHRVRSCVVEHTYCCWV